MMLWDGLNTDEPTEDSSTSSSSSSSSPASPPQITVLCATNRPQDIDKAILRRLPRSFLFHLPDDKERTAILAVILKGQHLTEDFSYAELAKKTAGYSGRQNLVVSVAGVTCGAGSDLKELCKYAAMIPIR